MTLKRLFTACVRMTSNVLMWFLAAQPDSGGTPGLVAAGSASHRSFSNSTMPIWAAVSQQEAAADQPPLHHFLFRPRTLKLGSPPATMRVLVSASPDMLVQNKILGLYKLYVNGIVVGVGPGGGDAHQTPTPGRGDNAVYDDIQVPLEVLERGAGTNCTLCV